MGPNMGIWQMFCLSSILRLKVNSVYPTYGGFTVRKHLNRLIIPRLQTRSDQNEIFILWSHLQGRTEPEHNWTPNHFVTMLPLDSPNEVLIDSEDDSGDAMEYCMRPKKIGPHTRGGRGRGRSMATQLMK